MGPAERAVRGMDSHPWGVTTSPPPNEHQLSRSTTQHVFETKPNIFKSDRPAPRNNAWWIFNFKPGESENLPPPGRGKKTTKQR